MIKKSKNCILILSAVAVLSLSITACGNTDTTANTSNKDNAPAQTEETVAFDIAEYKSLVAKCNEDILNESILLSNLGKYEHKYWESLNSVNGTIDYDSLILKAYEWLKEKGDTDQQTFENNYKDTVTQYDKIISMDTPTPEAAEIEAVLKNLYESYNALYQLVTAPSGDISSFADNYNTYSNEITNYNSTLASLVASE